MRDKGIFFLFLVPIFFFGCGPSIHIHSQIDPEYSFAYSDKIFVYLKENPSVTEKNFYLLLKQEMDSLGFQIVNEASPADKILLFSLDENTSDINTFYSLPSTTTTTVTAGDTKYTETTRGSTTIPYMYSYTVKKIYLELYKNQSDSKRNLTPIWKGYLEAGQEDYEHYTRECVRKLLEYYGSNFVDEVRIKR